MIQEKGTRVDNGDRPGIWQLKATPDAQEVAMESIEDMCLLGDVCMEALELIWAGGQ